MSGSTALAEDLLRVLCAATSSMSTPPSVEAMTASRADLAVERHRRGRARGAMSAALLDVDLADLLPLGPGLRAS